MKNLKDLPDLGSTQVDEAWGQIEGNMDEVDEWYNIDRELTRQLREEKEQLSRDSEIE